MPSQLPLQFEFQANQTFTNFYPGDNTEIINHLKQRFIQQEQLIYIWGDAGTGKTHLTQASSQIANNQHKSSICFSLTQQLPDSSLLIGLEKLDLVCFDNIEYIAGNIEWEQAFFNFFNRHRDHNKHLLLTANAPPKFLSIQLPDLKSRMAWGLTLKLSALDDEQQLNALIFRANNLGFKIPLNVGQFIMSHYARDLPSIWLLLKQIEQATLVEKRRITIPFLKKIIADSINNVSR